MCIRSAFRSIRRLVTGMNAAFHLATLLFLAQRCNLFCIAVLRSCYYVGSNPLLVTFGIGISFYDFLYWHNGVHLRNFCYLLLITTFISTLWPHLITCLLFKKIINLFIVCYAMIIMLCYVILCYVLYRPIMLSFIQTRCMAKANV